MKALFLTLIFSSLAQAEVSKFNPSETPCGHMQVALQQEGAILVKGLLGYYDYYFRDPTSCPMPFCRGIAAYSGSQDEMFCRLGFRCVCKPG